jgi:DnaJ-class molecular chaperone
MATEFPPVAVCVKCGDISYQAERINQRCGRTYGNRRCGGVYSSALNSSDWAICPTCEGAGSTNGATCQSCQRTGWIFVRDRRR